MSRPEPQPKSRMWAGDFSLRRKWVWVSEKSTFTVFSMKVGAFLL